MAYPMVQAPTFGEFRQRLERDFDCRYIADGEVSINGDPIARLERDIEGSTRRYAVTYSEDVRLAPSVVGASAPSCGLTQPCLDSPSDNPSRPQNGRAVLKRREFTTKKPGRPMTNRIINTIPATGEEIAQAICVAADGKVRQSLGQGQRPSVRPSASSRASASRRGRGPTSPSE